MGEVTSLSYVNSTLDHFEEHFKKQIDSKEINKVTINNQSKYVIFLSIGNPSIRARVLKEVSSTLSRGFSNLRKKASQIIRKGHLDPEWIKIDIVDEVEEISFNQLELKIAQTRRNYFRYGISFDSEFRLAFLEQEINGNAMMRSVKKSPIQFNEKILITI